MFRVIYKKHYVRKLKRRTTANFHSRRNALDNRCFCSTNKRLAKRLPFIRLKVNCTNKTMTDSSVCRRPFDINTFFLRRCKNSAVNIVIHRFSDFFYAFAFVRIVQVDFRKNDIQRRRFSFRRLFNVLPIIPVLRVLIAGNN